MYDTSDQEKKFRIIGLDTFQTYNTNIT